MVNLNNVKLIYGDNTIDHIASHKVSLSEVHSVLYKKNQDMINMRKYTAKDEEELIKQIESDTGLDSELEQQELVKGHVTEIRYSGKGKGKTTHVRKRSTAVHA
ncbi:MAG: hypothetical protein Q7J35_08725 [Candidatus Methanoperedens sp.]|nr:hypothetical protein [Candidatus Methanoperedens sp.]